MPSMPVHKRLLDSCWTLTKRFRISDWLYWRSLGDSNPCFRRERATRALGICQAREGLREQYTYALRRPLSLNRQWRAHEVPAEGNIDGDGIDAGDAHVRPTALRSAKSGARRCSCPASAAIS